MKIACDIDGRRCKTADMERSAQRPFYGTRRNEEWKRKGERKAQALGSSM